MSFDGYAKYIYEKYRLSVAAAVLKAKPPDLTTPEYIKLLQSKMADDMDNDHISICSDDFNMDDDDDTIIVLENIGDERNGDTGNDERLIILNDITQDINLEDQKTTHLPDYLTQSTYYNSSQSQIEATYDNDITYCEVANTENKQCNINNNLPKYVEKLVNYQSKINDKQLDSKSNENMTIKDASFNDKNCEDTNNNMNSQIYINNKSLDSKSNKPISFKEPSFKDNNEMDSNYDTQKTILYTVHGFTQNYTHYSPSQSELFIPNNYLYGTNNNKSETTGVHDNNNIEATNARDEDITVPNSSMNSKPRNLNLANGIDFTNKSSADKLTYEVVSKDNASENAIASQINKPCEEMHLFSQNIDDLNDSESILKNRNELPLRNLENSHNVYEYFNEINNFNDENHFNDVIDENIIKPSNENLINPFEIIQKNTTYFTPNNNNIDSQTTYIDSNKTLNIDKHTDIFKQNQNIEDSTQNFGPNIDASQKNCKEITPFEIIEEERETVEVVPYKVLEELNKIKMYLRKKDRRLSCDGYSTDSGYKSDSQLRSSNRSALQLSGTSINQSAYSLLNYMMQCPLQAATREITAEIAQAFGQLIDRLHEEENYPPFLEQLLETIDNLLQQVYKGQSCEDSEFLKKDEYVQRMLLLNKSIHIQKHAIDKITSILTKFHEKITDENVTYELINIEEVENISYIYHILEILLKKYIKNKNNVGQSSQLSQDEEKILKKSSITDIWRKKWNPNFKENSVGSFENRCVLKNCSEILNKIIVDCVNSYSLVAYCALKCFNCMQS